MFKARRVVRKSTGRGQLIGGGGGGGQLIVGGGWIGGWVAGVWISGGENLFCIAKVHLNK